MALQAHLGRWASRPHQLSLVCAASPAAMSSRIFAARSAQQRAGRYIRERCQPRTNAANRTCAQQAQGTARCCGFQAVSATYRGDKTAVVGNTIEAAVAELVSSFPLVSSQPASQ
eukprot:751869-Prymnesium_polylepis.1